MPRQDGVTHVVSEFAFADGVATPRKQPLQSRARQTASAILEATIQVLRTEGDAAATTTRVAEVAGVSVGTLYQYFPNREALLFAVLADHLEHAISALERACDANEGIEQIVRAFLMAKAERVEISRLLEKVFAVGRLDARPLVAAVLARSHVAIQRATGATLDTVVLGCAAVDGMVRSATETDPGRLADSQWIEQVVRIATRAFTS